MSTGLATVTDYAASEDDEIMIDATTARQLGSSDAIMTYFAEADFEVPPLEFVDATASPQRDAAAVQA